MRNVSSTWENNGGGGIRKAVVRTVGLAVRSAPLTCALCLVLLVVGVVTSTLWERASGRPWFDDVAYGARALEDGKWWTLVSGWFFGLDPGQLVTILVLVAVGLGWSEWRLGTRRLAIVAISGQLIGELGAALFCWLFSHDTWPSVSWGWADHLVTVRDVGVSTSVVASIAAASATLRSPWRLRARAILGAYIAISLLFEGTLADVQHVIAVAVMLPVGERYLSRGERGVMPRTRREVRMIGFIGLLLIAVVEIVVWFFPGSGPLGPTDAGDSSLGVLWVDVAIIALIADQLRRGKRWAWWIAVVIGSLNVVAIAIVLVGVAFTDFRSEGGVTLGTSLLWLVEIAVLIPGRFAFDRRPRPWFRLRRDAGVPGDESEQVRSLIKAHGGCTMSWMITWEGNEYLFGPGAGSVVGYQRHAGTLIALADPVCPPELLSETVGRFIGLAEGSGKTPCWFSVGAGTARLADALGWRSVRVAEDSIVDLPDLTLTGKSWQPIRSALNRARKEEIRFRLTTLAREPFAVRAQVRTISEEWVGDKGLPEMGFTLGGVEEALDPDVRVALAVDGDGSIHGVLSWLPVYASGGTIRGWTLDVMRRRDDGFRPVMEFLIGSSALAFKDEGARMLSLSGAPLARAGADSGRSTSMDRMLDTLGAALEPFYGFRSLHTFKKKFNPRYEPVYLCFRDEADLPRIGLAISRAYLPNATPAQLMRLAARGRG